MIIRNGLIHTLTNGFLSNTIYIEETQFADTTSDPTVLDASGCYVIPGLIDIHFHGCQGADFSDGTLESLKTIARYELLHGITAICPATMTLPEERLTDICRTAAHFRKMQKCCGFSKVPASRIPSSQKIQSNTASLHEEAALSTTAVTPMYKEADSSAASAEAAPLSGDSSQPMSDLVGIHLEGPFLSPAKKGAQKEAYICPPSEALYQKLQTASNGLIRLITMTPEDFSSTSSDPETNASLSFIQKHSDQVHISIGHTTADYALTKEAFAAGADHLTHLFNAMMPFHHRDPGPIGAAFEQEHVFIEMICDGIHLHPTVVNAMFRLFGADRIVLISDSMRATGLPDGHYELGEQPVTVQGAFATLSDGTIAASVSDLMTCVKTAVSMGIPLDTAVSCASYHPARSIGISDDYGSIAVGKIADCVLLDQQSLEIHTIIKSGQIVFSAC